MLGGTIDTDIKQALKEDALHTEADRLCCLHGSANVLQVSRLRLDQMKRKQAVTAQGIWVRERLELFRLLCLGMDPPMIFFPEHYKRDVEPMLNEGCNGN